MPPQKNKGTKIKKGIKKRFYEVDAPMTASKVHLYAASQEELDGRIVKLDLTRSLKGRGFELKLKVNAKGDEIKSTPISLKLASSYVRRVMRKGTDYVEDSFEAECKDNKVRIKPLLISRNRVSRAVLRALREGARKNLLAYSKTRSCEELFTEIMSNKLQRQLLLKLKKVYPLALCEIRSFEIVKGSEVRE